MPGATRDRAPARRRAGPCRPQRSASAGSCVISSSVVPARARNPNSRSITASPGRLVEVAGRLVREQQQRLGDEGARQARHAAARPRRAGPADASAGAPSPTARRGLDRAIRGVAHRPASSSGTETFSSAVMVGIRWKAWKTMPIASRRSRASASSSMPASSRPATRTLPRARPFQPASTMSRLVLPEPDGPTMPTASPRRTSQVDAAQNVDRPGCGRQGQMQVPDLDEPCVRASRWPVAEASEEHPWRQDMAPFPGFGMPGWHAALRAILLVVAAARCARPPSASWCSGIRSPPVMGSPHEEGFQAQLAGGAEGAGPRRAARRRRGLRRHDRGGRARLDWALADKPDAAIVELGANDGLRGLDRRQMEANLYGDSGCPRGAGIFPVLLSGMYAPPNLGPEYGACVPCRYLTGSASGRAFSTTRSFWKVLRRDPRAEPAGRHPSERRRA